MPNRMVGRALETRAIETLLAAASVAPTALILEGEPGIGKTTVWSQALQLARTRGFVVLTAQASQAESVMAYAAMSDLLAGVDDAVMESLPAPQRAALDVVLLRSQEAEAPADPQAVAAGFRSAIDAVAEAAPVLLAIDDVQWLDASSLAAIAFGARRFRGRIALLATERIEAGASGGTWFQMRSPDQMSHVRINPLDEKTLHSVISARQQVALSPPLLNRIHSISGGNPFYAQELVRAMRPSAASVTAVLPASLADLVASRVAGLDSKTRHVLLSAACASTPTVELMAGATDTDVATVMRLLEAPEDRGIVHIVGNTVHFTHPLLAHGVYAQAGAAPRRAMHRRLSEVVLNPELRARHLAMATTTADPDTVRALDEAAAVAFTRGAPSAAAELIELALNLGGDTEARRIQAAGFYSSAGDPVRAAALLDGCISRLDAGELRAQALLLLASIRHFNDDIFTAATLLDQAYHEAGDNLAVRVSASVAAVFSLINTADAARALMCAERAVDDATRLGDPGVLSQALGMRVYAKFGCGHGVDDGDLARALELEQYAPAAPIPARPSMIRAQALSWTGRFTDAIDAFDAIRVACLESGHESELLLVSLQTFVAEFWRGNIAGAIQLADDTAERAQMFGGEVPRLVAQTMQCGTLAITGRLAEARALGAEVISGSIRRGMEGMAYGPIAMVAMLENAVGNYRAALDVVSPVLFSANSLPRGAEFVTSMYMPEGIEALIHLGRHDDAEPFIEQLESNGARLDRPWTLAMGARYRSMLHAAKGDLPLAETSVREAMRHHDRLDMPVERARTQLLVSQLQRRQRQRDKAAKTLAEALATFERVGADLWVENARAQLRRTTSPQPGTELLSPSERRVAELAGSGMTNRDVAAALLISPKTVEANLARIYRKLGIRSRAELGRHMGGGAH